MINEPADDREAAEGKVPLACFARDVDSLPKSSLVAMTGYVTAIRKSRGAIFFDVRDVTGRVQAVYERGTPPAEIWDGIRNLTRMARVSIVGLVKATDRGRTSVFIDRPPVILGIVNGLMDDLDMELVAHSNSMLLSKIRRSATSAAEAFGFVEIETRFLSSTWPGTGLESLRATYPGFGSPVPLAVSPASQILDFMSATGSNRVCAVSRCFSTTYRVDSASSEAAILMLKATDMSSAEQLAMLEQIIQKVEIDLGSRPESSKPRRLEVVDSQPNVRDVYEIPVRGDSLKFQSLPVDVDANDAVWDRRVDSIFKLFYQGGAVLAEGSRELLESAISLSTTVIHLEQLLHLLQSLPARQLRDLGNFRLWDVPIRRHS